MIQVGSTVTWVAAAGRPGCKAVEKSGTVLAIIPKGQSPDIQPYFRTHIIHCNVARRRSEQTYLVERDEPGGKGLYWPKVALVSELGSGDPR